MSRNRFTVVEHTTIPLSGDEWIMVKKDLNNGDAKLLDEAGLNHPVLVEGKIIRPIDWSRYEIERAAIYLLDWNLRDGNNKEMPLKKADGTIDINMLKALNPEDFDEVNAAILKHALERGKEKNALRESQLKSETGATPTPDPTSLSSNGSDLEAGTPS